MTVEQVNLTTLEIPSKWDIIPIHSSDRSNFRRCRRYWDWSSPSRTNLTVRADIHGINMPMFFGTGIHYALEQYYQPGLKRDPVEAFKTWWDIQWRGGHVTEDWLDKVHDLKPKPVAWNGEVEADSGPITAEYTRGGMVEPTLYQVRGLEDILPDPDHELWDEHKDLGIGMMTYYKEYADRKDDFEVLVSEHGFSVPIWDFDNGTILKRVDLREDSPNYGNELEVHARGRMDMIKQKPNGKISLQDHKTAGRWGEEELLKLETDEQCTHYLWAAEIEATYYGLPHAGIPLEELTYNVLRKAYPKPPTELKNGMFSVDRQNESTTYEILQSWIAKNLPGIPLSESQQNYVDYLRDIGDEAFIIRKPVRRNRHQLKNSGYRLYLETLDMLDPSLRIYPNLSNSFKCLNCAFRPPCIASEDGGDWEQLIKDNYTTNKNR